MRILVISESSWNDKDSLGNSLSNWFDSWDDSFYHFFVRKVVPNNKNVSSYYNLTTKDIIKGLLKFNIKGLFFSKADIDSIKSIFEQQTIKEQKIIKKIHSKKGEFAYYLNELIWRTKFWLNKNCKSFLDAAHPDIIFALTKSGYISIPIIKYCKKKYGTKLVLYSADDVYGQYLKYRWYRRSYLIRHFKWLINNADKLLCCSPAMTEYYNKTFDIKSTWLSKGCTFNDIVTSKDDDFITIVYAGNLLYGRDKTLLSIAESISKIECKNNKFLLTVLTTSTENDSLKQLQSNYDFVRVEKNVDYKDVAKLMNDSHYVLVVESFEEKYLSQTKYSFSTKISDAIQSGSGVLAIGSNSAGTIDYLSKVNGVISAHSIEEIDKVLIYVRDNRNAWLDSAKKIRESCLEKFNGKEISQNLRKDFIALSCSMK